jgi:hypothetical protein
MSMFKHIPESQGSLGGNMFTIQSHHPTGINGVSLVKVLTGRDGICVEFQALQYATNVKRWKTRKGAERFLSDRPGMVDGYARMGVKVIVVEEK